MAARWRMASKKSWGLIIALLLFLLPVGVCAQETEGQIFVLSAKRLEALMDTALSRGIVFDERGMVLTPGEESGEYVSHAVEMAEFTMMALTWDSDYASDACMPKVGIAVWRDDEQAWSPFVDMSDGKAAQRKRGSDSTVKIRLRIMLARDGQNEPVLRSLVVSGGDHFFTQENLIMMFLMLAALGVFLYRKRLARAMNAKESHDANRR